MSGSRSSHFEPAELPVACSLDASEGSQRLADWRALSERGDASVRREPGQITIRYRHGAGVVEELDRLAAAERRCCSFADWRVIHDRDWVELQIRAEPEGLEAIGAVMLRA
jgi:ABC-type phosphonate transport system ATPase subunit